MKRKWPWVLGAAFVLLFALGCFGLTLGAMGIAGGGLALSSLGADTIAVVRVEGTISGGYGSTDLFSGGGAFSARIVEQLERARNDPSVKAVILRVDSPGGAVVASDEIYQAVTHVRERGKKVVVSMGDLAASGGYYVSAPADHIVANGATLTGSIGVISVNLNMQELLKKVGVQPIIIKSGAQKDDTYGFRDLTAEERAVWQSIIDDSFGQFVGVVAQGRNMSEAEVRKLADGRVYTGRQARALGLVDEIGNLPEAVNAAVRLAGLEHYRVVEYRSEPTLMELLTGALARPAVDLSVKGVTGMDTSPKLQYLFVP